MQITAHAYGRARQRLSWGSGTLDKMARRAFNDGVPYEQTRGRLRDYLTTGYEHHANGEQIRLFGEHIYIFERGTLITLYKLPNDLKRSYHRAAERVQPQPV